MLIPLPGMSFLYQNLIHLSRSFEDYLKVSLITFTSTEKCVILYLCISYYMELFCCEIWVHELSDHKFFKIGNYLVFIFVPQSLVLSEIEKHNKLLNSGWVSSQWHVKWFLPIYPTTIQISRTPKQFIFSSQIMHHNLFPKT